MFKVLAVLLIGLLLISCGGGSSGGEEARSSTSSSENDVSGSSSSVAQNEIPAADAGIDAEVNEGDVVQLNGSNSIDPDGSIRSYVWTQIDNGAPSVVINNAAAAEASFTVPSVSGPTELVFQLTVTDNEGASNSDTVTTKVFYQLPTAEAGPDQTVQGGFTAKLSAASSLVHPGKVLTYEWKQLTEHHAFYITAAGTITAAADTQDLFVYIPATEAGKDLTFSVTVSDGTHTSEADTITLSVADCVDGAGDVFIECIDPSWAGIASYQQIGVDDGNNFYSNGTDNHVTWSIIDLEDGEHNNVIDVKFNREDATGNFSITAPVPDGEDMPWLDMSDFSDGFIEFDIRSVGATESVTLFLDVQCIYPCAISPQYSINTLPDNEWKSVTIGVDELIDLGLDVSTVSTALIINPLWGMQAGVNIQLDNIRWRK